MKTLELFIVLIILGCVAILVFGAVEFVALWIVSLIRAHRQRKEQLRVEQEQFDQAMEATSARHRARLEAIARGGSR